MALRLVPEGVICQKKRLILGAPINRISHIIGAPREGILVMLPAALMPAHKLCLKEK